MSRNGAWSDAEVTALISIWGDAEIQKQLDGATRNKSIFLNISRKLKDNGYERDWQQCRAKIKNLKGDYKKVKDHNGVTGNGRKTFKFYDKLDEILGHRSSSVPSVLLDAGSSSATTVESQASTTEEGETGNRDGNFKTNITVLVVTLISIHTDTNDVQVLSSVDSALVPSEASAAVIIEPKSEDHG